MVCYCLGGGVSYLAGAGLAYHGVSYEWLSHTDLTWWFGPLILKLYGLIILPGYFIILSMILLAVDSV